MKFNYLLPLLLLMGIVVISCGQENEPGAPARSLCVTGEYSDLVPNAVSVYGWCNQEGEEGVSVIYGIEYSPTDLTTNAISVKAEARDQDNKFCCKLIGLLPETKYFYRAYVLYNGTRTYGDVKTFITPPLQVSVSGKATNIGSISATISGKLAIESEGTFAKSAVLYYSSSAITLNDLKSSRTKNTLDLESDGCFSVLVSALERKTKYYCVIVATVDDMEFHSSVISFTTTKPSCPYGAVDLGLSVCWSTTNLRATTPEEYGGYYQWAGLEDVTSKDIYLGLNNCPYHFGSNENSGWNKYISSDYSFLWSGAGSPDNKTVLDPEDDVAHIVLGGTWRMPTNDEWAELKNNCTCRFYRGTLKVTSNKPGYTDKSIVLPAAGFREMGHLEEVGSIGIYWSSSTSNDSPQCAHGFYFDLAESTSQYIFKRYVGYSVRPVSE